MFDTITLTGVIGTEPKPTVSAAGHPILTFRLATSQSRFDRATNRWVELATNWYSVSAYRQLAINSRQSLRKGEHVVVVGRLRLKGWTNGERSGTAVDVDADSIGHDLFWCTTSSSRSLPAARRTSTDEPPMQDQGGEQRQDAQGAEPVTHGVQPTDGGDATGEHSLAALDS